MNKDTFHPFEAAWSLHFSFKERIITANNSASHGLIGKADEYKLSIRSRYSLLKSRFAFCKCVFISITSFFNVAEFLIALLGFPAISVLLQGTKRHHNDYVGCSAQLYYGFES